MTPKHRQIYPMVFNKVWIELVDKATVQLRNKIETKTAFDELLIHKVKISMSVDMKKT